MARATISLPVPDSPVMATLALDGRDLLDQLEHPAHRAGLADEVRWRPAA